MNWDQIEGKWTELKGKARSSWGELTDDDVDELAGKRDQLVGKLQQKYGLAREEAEKQADEWAKDL
ncbi:CsbD family protein [Halomonas sp. MA07-2]|uniref:CsbD family protein n=1 Tax=unclassified Halomonas TaxID=2609666 RepID=UPI003EEE3A96